MYFPIFIYFHILSISFFSIVSLWMCYQVILGSPWVFVQLVWKQRRCSRHTEGSLHFSLRKPSPVPTLIPYCRCVSCSWQRPLWDQRILDRLRPPFYWVIWQSIKKNYHTLTKISYLGKAVFSYQGKFVLAFIYGHKHTINLCTYSRNAWFI